MDFPPLPERSGVSPDQFRDEIVPAGEPVVLRGIASHWPICRAADDADALSGMLQKAAGPEPVPVSLLPEREGGRFFYAPTMRGMNFQVQRAPFAAFIAQLFRGDHPGTIYMGSRPVSECAPGLAGSLDLAFVPDGTEPRLWIGGRTVVSTHHDESSNIACVAAGRRRFTLFPPEQLRNLYPSPMEYTPAGPQISMVDLAAPDFERFPRFREALATARTAELGPGDGIYIPPLWWHDVRAQSDVNVLVNFWWRDRHPISREPIEAFVLSLLALRQLPAPEKEAWRDMFDYFIFQTEGDPMAHLPEEDRGVLGTITRERADQIWSFFRDMVSG